MLRQRLQRAFPDRAATAPEPILGAADLALAGVVGRVVGAHPGLKPRLAGFGAAAVIIDAVELPFALIACFAPDGEPSVRAARPGDVARATARVSGSFLALLDLVEGRVDGDTLFFRRDLRIDGDVESVVALRNALDGESIDIAADLLSSLAAIAGPLRAFGQVAAGLWRRVGAGPWQDLFLAPVVERLDRMDKSLGRLAREVESLRRHDHPERR